MKICFKMYQLWSRKRCLSSIENLKFILPINPNLNLILGKQEHRWSSTKFRQTFFSRFNWRLCKIRCLFCLINNEDVTWCCMYTIWTKEKCCLFVCHISRSTGTLSRIRGWSEEGQFTLLFWLELKFVRNLRILLSFIFLLVAELSTILILHKINLSWSIAPEKMMNSYKYLRWDETALRSITKRRWSFQVSSFLHHLHLLCRSIVCHV